MEAPREPSGEDKLEMEKRMKAMMEAQKRAGEEQRKLREKQVQMNIKQLQTGRKLIEKSIERIKADRDVVEQVDMAGEKNDIRRKAMKAKLAEMDAIIEGEKLKLEMIDFNLETVKKQMDQAAAQGRQE